MSISRENDISQMENRVNRVKNEVYKKNQFACTRTSISIIHTRGNVQPINPPFSVKQSVDLLSCASVCVCVCVCMSVFIIFFFFLSSSRTWQTTENRERLFDKNVERRSFHWIATPYFPWKWNAFAERHETKEADLDSKLRYRSAGNAPFAAQSAPNDVRILSWLGAFGGAGLVWWPPSRILRPCRRTPVSGHRRNTRKHG